MKRDLHLLESKIFDLLIIGGGIYGSAVAWEAALNGLSVALIEKRDFGHGTSANSLKIIHGGLRYLQNVDLRRMRKSIMARRTLLRIAPHLVQPLKFIVPTFGKNIYSRPASFFALLINDLISWDRNRALGRDQAIPRGTILTKGEFLKLVPGFKIDGCTGGAVWYDAIVANSERLTLELVCSAVYQGACAVNYVKAEDLITENRKVRGVSAVDQLTGQSIPIRARFIVKAMGPHIDEITNSSPRIAPLHLKMTKAVNVFIKRSIFKDYAVGFYGRDDFGHKGMERIHNQRAFFCVPWNGGTLIGTTYHGISGFLNDLRVTHHDVKDLLDRFNYRWPDAGLSLGDVGFCHAGLVPVFEKNLPAGMRTRLQKNSIFIDHYKRDGIQGLISIVGVKYTTAIIEARDIVVEVCKRLGQSNFRRQPVPVLPGAGRLRQSRSLGLEGSTRLKEGWNFDSTNRFKCHYGTTSNKIRMLADKNPDLSEPVLEGVSITAAEVVHFAREEMAQKISDILLRRTNVGWFGFPGDVFIQRCGEIMSEELGWDLKRKQAEIDDVKKEFTFLRRSRHLGGRSDL